MKRSLFALALFLAALLTARCETTYVPVAGHSEEALTWCGAATGQMVIGAYPSSPCSIAQADVWASIQSHKIEGAWDTDPAGLRDAMTALCPVPAGGHWAIFADPSEESLMHSVARWMRTNNYPVALLLGNDPPHHPAVPSHREHWVTVRGVGTDVDPVANATVNLQLVVILDQPEAFGDPPVERTLSGTQWYSELEAVSIAGSAYNGKFVAVIEPPKGSGRAVAPARRMSGAIIAPERAVALARDWARNPGVRGVKFVGELRRMQPQTPLLINRDFGGYYLVPFAAPGKPATTAVLINAYDGLFLEAGRYGARTLPTEQEAQSLALRFLARRSATDVRTALVSEPGAPYFPVWRVVVDGRALDVGRDGRVVVRSVAERKE